MKLKIFTSSEKLSVAVEEANRSIKEMQANGYEAVSVGISERLEFLEGYYEYVLKVKYLITENPHLYKIEFVDHCDTYQRAIEKLEEFACEYEDMDVCECTSIFDGTDVSGVVLFKP